MEGHVALLPKLLLCLCSLYIISPHARVGGYVIGVGVHIYQTQVFPFGHLRLIRFTASISGTAHEYLN